MKTAVLDVKPYDLMFFFRLIQTMVENKENTNRCV